jgi:hypothetical protein
VGRVETDPRHAKARSALLEAFPLPHCGLCSPGPCGPTGLHPNSYQPHAWLSITNSKSCFLDMLVTIEFVNAEGEASGVHPTLPKAGICRLEPPTASCGLATCIARPEQRPFSEMCPLIRCLGVAGLAGAILICGSCGSPTSTDLPGCDLRDYGLLLGDWE